MERARLLLCYWPERFQGGGPQIARVARTPAQGSRRVAYFAPATSMS